MLKSDNKSKGKLFTRTDDCALLRDLLTDMRRQVKRRISIVKLSRNFKSNEFPMARRDRNSRRKRVAEILGKKLHHEEKAENKVFQ